MHTIITFTTSDFCDAGLALLKTWRLAADQLIVYGLGFLRKQIKEFTRQGVVFRKIYLPDFKDNIMYYKFVIIRDYLLEQENNHDFTTYLDYDTMVSRDWRHIFNDKFDVGVTVRPNARSKILNTNGGVIFIQNGVKALQFFSWATQFIYDSANSRKLTLISGEDINEHILSDLDEYYEIAEQCKVNICQLRWWCDQLFTSALCEKIYKKHGKDALVDYKIYKMLDYAIGLFNCPIYNDTSEFTLEDIHDPEYLSARYVIHFKGRRKKRVYKFFLEELKNVD